MQVTSHMIWVRPIYFLLSQVTRILDGRQARVGHGQPRPLPESATACECRSLVATFSMLASNTRQPKLRPS